MSVRHLRKIVVDANIARSAGTATEAPVSSHSRSVLLAILKRGHLLVLSRMTSQEWDTHQSKFSRTWRTTMQQRGRIYRVEEASFQGLVRKIGGLPQAFVNQQALLKDSHIIGSALCTDKIIITNDLALVANVQQFASFHEVLLKLMWGNTIDEGDLCIAWVEGGAKTDRKRYTSERPSVAKS